MNAQDYAGMKIVYNVAADSLGELEDRAQEFAEFCAKKLEEKYPGAEVETSVVPYRTRQNETEVIMPSGASSYGSNKHEMEEVQEAEKFAEWIDNDTNDIFGNWCESLSA